MILNNEHKKLNKLNKRSVKMAVVIETTLGDITVDLYLDQRPVTCLNFLKLCKMKYYNFNLFHTIRNGFIAQTGDPSGEGSGGQSIFGILEGPHKRFFSGEKMPKIRHTDAGLLSMVCTDDMMVGSQFFFTLAPDLNSLDGTHCVIGEVTDGHDVLAKLNEVICDESHRPYRDVRVTHTVVLEDPFNDPSGLRAPSRSPSPSAERLKGGRIAPDEEIDEAQGKSAEEIQEMIEEKEAKARATILEIVGDLPDAEIAPPENVLFVCKLNPVTTDEDLEIIFCRFGKIVSCEVIRDKKTGNSLQYAFIEFDNKKSCEDAYFKMDNVLIDDRRIHVDFSQSVSKMRWLGKGRGVQYFDNDSKKMPQRDDVRGRYREQKPEHINNRRHHENDRNVEERNRKDREREYDRDHKEIQRDRELKKRERSQNRDHKERSRSRSKHNYDRRHESRKDRNKSSKDNNKHRDHTENRESSYRHDKNRNSHQSYHRSRSSPIRNDRSESRESSSRTIRDISETKNGSRTHNKKKENNRHDKSKYNKLERESKQEKQNSNKHFESKTPSPITKDLKQSSKIDKNPDKKHRDIKLKKKERKSRKHKHSTSSVSSSESSTSDSSSSGSDRKKRKVGKKKRKRSTSSSSSDTSSSSTSSSSDSSSDSSTSSDSSHEKRKRKNKKNVKKK